jgi:hypothetical protein
VPARRAFPKLARLGFGKSIKSNGKCHFHVKGMTYPEPPKKIEQTEAKPKNAKTKDVKA